MEKLLYTGKAKQMWQTDDPEVLRVVYMDQATALNGKKKEHFAGKGEAANAISSLVFQYLIKHGIETHFIKKLSANEDLVKKCTMFPLEFVTRNVVAGHFASRYGLDEGKKLPEPVEETFYKSDELDDPFINESATIALGIATHAELEKMWDICREVNGLLTPLFEKATQYARKRFGFSIKILCIIFSSIPYSFIIKGICRGINSKPGSPPYA